MSASNETKLAKIALIMILACILVVITATVIMVIPLIKHRQNGRPTPFPVKSTPTLRPASPKPAAPSFKPSLQPSLKPTPVPPATPKPFTPREWYKYRQDKAMTGYSKGTAMMKNAPICTWSYDIAGWQGYFVVKQMNGYHDRINLPTHAATGINYYETNQSKWGLGSPQYDLYGNGSLITVTEGPALKVAPLLKDRPGLQKVTVDNYYEAGNNARARLYAYSSGNEQLIWTSESFTNCYGPVVCIADANNDGQLDVIIAMHYRLVVLNGATGVTMMSLNYSNQRNYGFLGASYIAGDPYPKFCIISDFSQYIAVIDNNGTSLSLKWLLAMETGIYHNTHITQPEPDSFGDVDHDGRLEVVCNIFNYNNNNRWNIVVFDAQNGTVKYELTNRRLNGLVDLNGDGYRELFTTTTAGPVIPVYGELNIYQLVPNQGATRLWTCQNARFNTRDLDKMPLATNTMAAGGRSSIVSGRVSSTGSNDFFTCEPGNQSGEILKNFRFDDSHQVRNLLTINGPPNSRMDVLAVGGANRLSSGSEILLSLTSRGGPGETVITSNGSVELKQWARKMPFMAGPPVAADFTGNGRMAIVTSTNNMEVICFDAPRFNAPGPKPDNTLTIRWRTKGQGMTKDTLAKQDGILAADLDNDGRKELIFARETPTGKASIVAADPSGTFKWQHVFPGFNGAPPVWNLGGVTYWIAGNFTSRNHQDLYVSIRRGKMHSDVGFLLDGRDGHLIWERDGILIPGGNPDQDMRGHGGDRVAAADMNRDGFDELVFAYPDRVYIVDGRSGNPLVIKSTAKSLFPGFWTAYAAPVVVNLSGGPGPDIVYGRSGYITALLDSRVNVLWQRDYNAGGNNGCNYLQGIGDCDHDGQLEIGGTYQTPAGDYEFRIYQGKTGESYRQYPLSGLGTPCTDVVTADLDSDGADEFLFGIGGSLVCIGAKGLKWSVNLKSNPGELSLADVDRDGKLEILVCTRDGFLRILK